MTEEKRQNNSNNDNEAEQVNYKRLLVAIAAGVIIWLMPTPEGVTPEAWQLFSIFVATILGFILRPFPMGVIAFLGITTTVITNTLTIDEALSGFANSTIWLIVIAFFLARGFIKTGLGRRISYVFIKRFGKKTLGLSYALNFSNLVLGPTIPSNTSRAGGIVFPIVRSICDTFDSNPDDGTERKVGSFLMKSVFQGDLAVCAMFMTAMAANPLIVEFASDVAGIQITWTRWFTAALVPGLATLLIVPYVIYKIYPPEVKETPEASDMASEELDKMGALKTSEKFMMLTFIVVLVLWIFGEQLGVGGTAGGLIGLCLLLLTRVLSWEDIKSEKGAWNTLVWFAALVMMAGYLNELGLVDWFTEFMGEVVAGWPGMMAFLVLAVVYYYSHYFFASMTAHITAMYGAFLGVSIAAGAPPMLAALVLAFFSNLFASTTHYGTGTAPIYFGAGFVPQKTWWKTGFMISVIHIILWVTIGGAWWKLLGLW
ncbi:divalent anion:Na+ symporter, DASS family [Halarsenatibacter silvermanii]|uniref:Divalent anion:Na+ symporter, DASS family n=1 Tax=Halarsenatibacter silvermanii TaxID=321763 RepID=A0A1G9MCY4_9FIRM|nr:anion permease [Halarsenatibacter silvermanii]SDL72059.1 divalent anion:Na+ symporter, DASS family [Halarsenatibacter silvermanii]